LDIEGVEKKLREAQFFLNKMIKHERWTFVVFGDKDYFDFYLSAFLNPGRTVDYRLRHEQEEIYPTWRTGWDATLTQAQQGLIKFMVDDRNVEVHRSGSSRRPGTVNIELGAGTHQLKSATVTVAIPPGVPSGIHMQVPTYNFTIDGTERKVTEACGEYLALLKQMVAKFKADLS